MEAKSVLIGLFDTAQILSCCHISTARYAPIDSKMTSKTSNSSSGSKDIPGNLYPQQFSQSKPLIHSNSIDLKDIFPKLFTRTNWQLGLIF